MTTYAEVLLLWTAISLITTPVIGRFLACSSCDYDWAGGEDAADRGEREESELVEGGLLEGEESEYA